MEQETRNKLQRATQLIRRLLEDEFAEQLEGTFNILATGRILPNAGKHLDARQLLIRQKLVNAIQHIQATGRQPAEAVQTCTREAAFTFLNRFVALRMMEARGLVQECVSRGDQSNGFREFCGLAPGLAALPDAGYRLYLECLCDELSVEIKVLFNRRDSSSLLWPGRATLTSILEILAQPELSTVWAQDETIGWVYQYYNDEAERRKMREESAAPRNSRELAVRNQFFTPRYVVQFLTDNTLGRIWYEMTRGQTALRERCQYLVRRPTEIFLQPGENAPASAADDADSQLSQAELLQAPVYIPHRALKDPRDIRLLDPACGSMHFGLYAFDLFSVIYEEAWHIATTADHPAHTTPEFAPFLEFVATCSDKAAFLRDVPRLIIQHNIHGIDIDPRAAQIANLAIWLRAQRAWFEGGIDRASRPRILRSNIVCAEPMPGDKTMLADFVERQFPETERPAFKYLLETIFDKMTLAGEAGSLLRIEEEISTAVSEAHALARKQSEKRQKVMFADSEEPRQDDRGIDLRGLTDEGFWRAAEERIYGALEGYAEQAESSGGFQRRLFAEDAAKGFAFIELCRKGYDAVVMNPPFGKATGQAEKYLKAHYKDVWTDIYGCFLWRFIGKWASVGCISSSLFLYTKQMRELRRAWINRKSLHYLIELGGGILDGAAVETALTITLPRSATQTCFLDLTDEPQKASSVARLTTFGQSSITPKLIPLNSFSGIYLHPFCYHLDPEKLALWVQNDRIDPDFATVTVGNNTFDDYRFQRLRIEVCPGSIGSGWFGYEEGGEYQPYSSATPVLYNWAKEGFEARAFQFHKFGTDAQVRQSISWWWKPGLTYPRVSSIGFGPRVLPEGHIFSGDSISLFSKNNNDLLPMLGFLTSTWAQDLSYAFGRYRKIEARAIANLPLERSQLERFHAELASLAMQGFREVAALEQRNEASPFYVLPFSCFLESSSPNAAGRNELSSRLQQIGTATDSLVGRMLFGQLRTPPFNAKLRSQLVERFTQRDSSHDSDATNFLSLTFGATLGRWDIRYATGERQAPDLPDPFAVLPVCPPGMLQGDDGLPLTPEAGRQLRSEGRYPLDIVWDGVLVDDPEHPLDVAARVRQVLAILWGDRSEAIEQEACSLLEVRSLSDWFRRPAGFFSDHLKRYSKSRRKAPIYWSLSTPSTCYTVWLYYHRFNKDTFFRVSEIVREKLTHEQRKQDRLKSEFGPQPSRSQTKELEAQEKIVNEIKTMSEEVDRIAPLWNPNLNDGVIINYAPLWRLVPHHRAWQKDCKDCWDSLVAGEYDWAHLAMHLWPERVVPKCVTDASLAIAHCLDDVFWQQNDRQRLQPKPKPADGWQPVIDQLVQERSSPAVKAALKSLLDAPVANAATKNTRKRRGT